jgi:hypothetical protein
MCMCMYAYVYVCKTMKSTKYCLKNGVFKGIQQGKWTCPKYTVHIYGIITMKSHIYMLIKKERKKSECILSNTGKQSKYTDS